MKILVIQQKMIGDVLASSILCNNLKKLYPTAQVDYLINPFTKPVVENNPNIDHLVYFEDSFRKSKRALFGFLMAIRRRKYDLVIDAYGKTESNLIIAFSGAGIKIGFHKSYTRFLYTQTVNEIAEPKTNAGTALENRLNLLEFTNAQQPLDNKPKIWLTPEEIQHGRRLLEENQIDFSKKLYMIGVLGSGNNKTYPFPFMAAVLDFIVQSTGATLLFNYMPSQQKEAQEIYELCQAATRSHIRINIIPGSIREFLSITYHCDALIGNEGGAVNMAKALDIPTFTIFSTWIKKEAWNSFENGTTNVSVHLKDFKPALYGGKSPKEMKGSSLELYKEFTPDLIIPALRKYLTV